MAPRAYSHGLSLHLLMTLLALSQPALAQNDAKAWLDRMTQAVQSLNYEGTFVLMHDGDIDTMKIVHGHDKDGVRERLMSLTGEAREFIRDSDVLTCYWPGSKFVVVETTRKASSTLSAALPADFDKLKSHYRFEIGDTARIAGRRCRDIGIQPLDALRYGYRFCIGERSGMLLKSQMLSPEGEVIEQMMFTSLTLRESIPAELFEPTKSGENYTWHTVGAREHADLEPDPGWHVGTLPSGFRLVENVKRPIAASPQPVQHMILTDGLASVSVFIAKPEDLRRFFRGVVHRGAINAYATHLANHQITVVGEVPETTVKLIGNSISYNESVESALSDP